MVDIKRPTSCKCARQLIEVRRDEITCSSENVCVWNPLRRGTIVLKVFLFGTPE